MKKEKNRKRKEIRRRTHSLQYRVISFMCALLLICSTVLLDTGYISMASSFDDESIVEEVATDEFDPEVEVQDTEGSDVDFQQIDDVEGESIEEAGGMDAGALDFSSEADWSADTFAAGDAADNTEKVTYTKLINNDSVEIKAEVPAGALPEGAELQVNAIEENTDQYAEVAGRLNELVQNQDEELAGFLAYDIYFTDADGQRTEPAEKVNYSIQYAEAFAPQLTDAAATSVAAVKIQKNTETNETELVQLNAEADQLALEVNENRQLQKAGFQSANTAAFAFTWTTKKAQATEPVEEQPAEGNPEEVIEQPTEETVSTPIGTIQITEDEVNVRTSPSTEAEILDVVFVGDQLPLLETVTAEDGSIWFKVLYGENVGYVRSDVAAVVEEQQEAVAEEIPQEETDNTLTFTKKVNDLVEVVATTEAGVIPADAELVVNSIEKETTQYDEVAQQLDEKAASEDYSIAGFLAYDIYFQDSEGNKIEPESGKVKVSMNYTEASVPEEVKQAAENANDITIISDEEEFSQGETTNQISVAMMHLVEDENGNVQSVVDMTQEGAANVETSEDGKVQKAEFETESFSTFTIVWKNENGTFGTNLIIKYVDEEGNEINVPDAPTEIKMDDETKVVNLSAYAAPIIGYDYTSTKLDSLDGLDISYVKLADGRWSEERTPLVSADGETWNSVPKSSVIYMVYSQIDPGSGASNLEIQRQKYIDKNNDGTYDVTLNVSGSVETQITKAKVDVVMVADVSGSMNDNSKLSNMKTAIRALVDTFNGKNETVDTKYQLVTFSNYGNNNTDSWKTGDDFYTNYVENLKADGGTNYDQGLKKAKTCLDTAREDATKIVIFLIDGQPTFYGATEGKKPGYPYGRGNATSEKCITEAINAALQLSCDKFYGVGVGLKNKIDSVIGWDNTVKESGYVYEYDSSTYGGYRPEMWSYEDNTKSSYKDTTRGIDLSRTDISGLDILQWVTNEVNAATKEAMNFDVNNSTELTNKFQSIAGDALTIACSNVSIEDTLSQYVQPTAKSKLEIKVMSKATDGTYAEIARQLGGENVADTSVTVDGAELSAHYDTNSKKVTLTFPPSYNLKENYYYYVTITNLEPTQAAYDEYQKAGYNAAGDKLTDASEDKNYGENGGSSSEQPGFNSNSEAKVYYTYKNADKSVDYAKPVIQVLSSDIVKSKSAQLVNWEDRTYNITLNASSMMEEIKAANPVDVVLVFDRSGSMNFRSSLTPYGNYKVSNLKGSGPYYYVTSDEAATMYRVWKSGKNWHYLDDSDTGDGTKITEKSKILNTKDTYKFYTDGDEGHDRFYYLKQAATQFTTELAQISPQSRVALVSFAKYATEDFSMAELSGANLNSLNSTINGLETSGGTNQGNGLTTAASILDKNQSGHKQYVVLLTDGCPNGSTYSEFEAAANNVKSITNTNGVNTTLMTVGVGLVDNEQLLYAKSQLRAYASVDGNGNPYSYGADSASQLVGIFKSILKSITAKAPIEAVDVIDYIDPRFDLTNDAKRELEADPNVELTKDENGCVTCIKWINQTVPEAGAGSAGWSTTFKVKAKDSFIGGNNITTNGAGSGVVVKGKLLEFEQPTVNVRVNININDKEVTIYKGDPVPTEKSILKQIFDTENTITSYKDGKVDVSKVNWKWYKDPACTVETSVDEMTATEPNEKTVYYLKVTYDAGAPSEESNANSTLDGTTYIACGENHIEELIGTYTVRVIKGQIEITKKVDVAPTTDKTFTFNVTKDGVTYGEPLTVTVKANTTVGEATAKLENLARGTYVVTETTVDEYVVGETTTDGTNCEVSTNDGTHAITFKLGYEKDKTDVDVIKKETDTNGNIINYTYREADGGILGKVEYTNQEIKTDLDLKKTDTDGNNLSNAKFNLEKKSNDGWVSAGEFYNNFEVKNDDTIELRDLRNGYYRLTEVEAPTGCSLLATEIYFKVDKGTVTLTNEAGEIIDSQQKMWTLGDHVLTIKNAKIYSLPSSGGSGTYLYTISGVAFITAALLLFINNKRKEGKARA